MLEINVTMAITPSNCLKYTWNTIFLANLLKTENQMCLFTIQHLVYTYQNQKVILWSFFFMLPWHKSIKPSMNLPKNCFQNKKSNDRYTMCIIHYSTKHVWRLPPRPFLVLCNWAKPNAKYYFYVQWSMKYWSRLNMHYCFQQLPKLHH